MDTPRERFYTACEHKEPDRVPVDFGGLIATILDAGPYGYRALAEHLNITDYEKPAVAYILNSVANVDERILKRLNVDIRHVFPPNAEAPIKFEPNGMMTVVHGVRLKTVGSWYHPTDFPLADAKKAKEIEEYPKWADPNSSFYLDGTEEMLKDYKKNTDYAVMALSGYWGMIWHTYHITRGFDQCFVDLKLNPEIYEAMMERITSMNCTFMENYFSKVGDYPDLIQLGDDMGSQEGPYLKPEDYRKYIKPYWKRVIDTIKEHSDAKIMMHSCGSIYQLLPDFIDIGIDIINPIQPLAKDMEPEKLKRDFGDKIVLHGGIDEQRLLAFGTKEEVIRGTKDYLKILAPGGGYIGAASHNIEPETPPEVAVAMYDTIREVGTYPINID
ncbi:MAG: uroporphyrinogen decarboxylase family protein [Methanomassiliicoccales archaeon]